MNKSKQRTLIILVAVLVVACVATILVSRHEEEKEKIQNTDETIIAIDPETVTALSWKYDETELSFSKNEVWQWSEDSAFPVDGEKIADLLSVFESFGASFKIEEVEDYAQYGLDDPTAVITITVPEGVYEIKLGTFSTMDQQRYITVNSGNVYLCSHDPMEDYELTIEDMICDDEIPDLGDATQIVFTGAANYTVTYEEESNKSCCADDVYFTGDLPLDTLNVTSYLQTISSLTTDPYVCYNATDDDLAAYGLDNPEIIAIVTYPIEEESDEEESEDAEKTVTYGTFTVSVGRNQEELAAAEKAAAEAAENESEEADTEEIEVTAYFRVGDSKIVYELPQSDYEALLEAEYNDLRHRELLTAAFADITAIDINLEDTTYSLYTTKEEAESEDEDPVITWYYNDTEIEDTAKLKSTLTALKAADFTDESPAEKEEVSFTVSLDNENFPTVEIAIYRYDGENCLATVNGEPFAFVTRSSVVSFIEAVNAIVL